VPAKVFRRHISTGGLNCPEALNYMKNSNKKVKKKVGTPIAL
jgi:hypothetical protein